MCRKTHCYTQTFCLGCVLKCNFGRLFYLSFSPSRSSLPLFYFIFFGYSLFLKVRSLNSHFTISKSYHQSDLNKYSGIDGFTHPPFIVTKCWSLWNNRTFSRRIKKKFVKITFNTLYHWWYLEPWTYTDFIIIKDYITKNI